MICVEPGIGYAGGHFAKWKIFESYAIYHAYCGLNNVGSCNQGWYDCVIPNYFDPDDFTFKEQHVVHCVPTAKTLASQYIQGTTGIVPAGNIQI